MVVGRSGVNRGLELLSLAGRQAVSPKEIQDTGNKPGAPAVLLRTPGRGLQQWTGTKSATTGAIF
jgi:hypothetical protein